MDNEEVLELAPVAIERVAHIATHIGATRLNEVCGRLGGELLIAASFLGSPEQEVHEQHDRFLQTTRKLLRDVEKICNVSDICFSPPLDSTNLNYYFISARQRRKNYNLYDRTFSKRNSGQKIQTAVCHY